MNIVDVLKREGRTTEYAVIGPLVQVLRKYGFVMSTEVQLADAWRAACEIREIVLAEKDIKE